MKTTLLLAVLALGMLTSCQCCKRGKGDTVNNSKGDTVNNGKLAGSDHVGNAAVAKGNGISADGQKVGNGRQAATAADDAAGTPK